MDLVGALLSILGMGGLVMGILVWQEGGENVAILIAIGAVSLTALGFWLLRRKRQGDVPLLDPDLLRSKMFRLGITGQMMQQIALGGSMIVVPIFLQMVLEYNAMQTGITLAPLSLTMFFVAMLAGKRAAKRRPAGIIRAGFGLLALGILVMIPIVPRTDSGWWLALPLFIMGIGLGLLVSQLNNYALAPISEERVSEAAGVNSASGSFGLSFGLAFAGGVMLATLSFTFTSMAQQSDVLPTDAKERVATVLEEDAQVMSTTQLETLLAEHPAEIAEEIIRINTESRPRALQAALLIPLVAALVGFVNGFRMMRLPDVTPSTDLEGMSLGG
jgi:LPXTG-motif cell wall-anchored protein